MSPHVTHLMRRLLAQYLAIDERDVAPSQELGRDLGLTPLDLVLLTLRLEEGFAFEFPFCRLEDARTVAQLAVVVEEWLRDRAALAGSPDVVALERLSVRPALRSTSLPRHERRRTQTAR